MSSRHPIGTASARSYADAYATHYAQHDLLEALRAYEQVIAEHPTTPEADYARSQMRNIIRLVIPAQELLDSQVELARQHLHRKDQGPAAHAPS
jgi:outer membrane protein assembly factor BamD (BamD/ComL family)